MMLLGIVLRLVYTVVIFVQMIFGGSLFDAILLFLLWLCCDRNSDFLLVVHVLISFLLFFLFFLFVRLTKYESNFVVLVRILFCILNVILSFTVLYIFLLLLSSLFSCIFFARVSFLVELLLYYLCFFHRCNFEDYVLCYVIYFIVYWMKFLPSYYYFGVINLMISDLIRSFLFLI